MADPILQGASLSHDEYPAYPTRFYAVSFNSGSTSPPPITPTSKVGFRLSAGQEKREPNRISTKNGLSGNAWSAVDAFAAEVGLVTSYVWNNDVDVRFYAPDLTTVVAEFTMVKNTRFSIAIRASGISVKSTVVGFPGLYQVSGLYRS